MMIGRNQRLLLITTMFTIVTSRSPDIEFLKSIKQSLHDPLHSLQGWAFNDFAEADDYICSFPGVGCWGRGAMIRAIELTGMGLRGEFPRGFDNCTSLDSLELSNNHLHGAIPEDISRLLPYLILLDLSNNAFSGGIPPGITNCSYLLVLALNDNALTGRVPPSLASLQRLHSFTVAGNLLSGRVPGLRYAFVGSYANNSELCGEPLDPCSESGKVISGVFVSGFLSGWGISMPLFLAVGLFTPFWECTIDFLKRKLAPKPRIRPLPMSQRIRNPRSSRLEKFAARMSFLELSQATNSFSEHNIIANGENGTVYKAALSNGYRLAIMKLREGPHAEREFTSEIMILGRLRHRNLVPLMGFCHESNDRFLVYKLMPKGSLHNRLFSSTDGESDIIEWPPEWIKIAAGVAKGIAWLHLNRVVHGGISSKCVLLDDDFNPRISGFGRATAPSHTNSVFTDVWKEDVKAFGRVLLELITGTKYIEIVRNFDVDGNMSEQISDWSEILARHRGLWKEDSVSGTVLSVVCKCLACDEREGPSMEEVHQMLLGVIYKG